MSDSESKCTECGRPYGDQVHSGKYEGSHFFNLGPPLVSDRPDVLRGFARPPATGREAQDDIYETLRTFARPMSLREVTDATRRGYTSVSDTLKKLERQGRVTSVVVRELRDVSPRPRLCTFRVYAIADDTKSTQASSVSDIAEVWSTL